MMKLKMPNSMNVQMILQRANNSYKNKIKKNKKSKKLPIDNYE